MASVRSHRCSTSLALYAAVATMASGCKAKNQPVEVVFTKLGSQPIEAQLPAGARVQDRMIGGMMPDDGGVGEVCVRLHGATADTTVCVTQDVYPVQLPDRCLKCWEWVPRVKSIDEDEQRLRDSLGSGVTIARHEILPDGWIIEARGQTPSRIAVRRNIGRTSWECSAESRHAEDLDAAIRLCTSLRVAP